jgi:hypothetical protein
MAHGWLLLGIDILAVGTTCSIAMQGMMGFRCSCSSAGEGVSIRFSGTNFGSGCLLCTCIVFVLTDSLDAIDVGK